MPFMKSLEAPDADIMTRQRRRTVDVTMQPLAAGNGERRGLRLKTRVENHKVLTETMCAEMRAPVDGLLTAWSCGGSTLTCLACAANISCVESSAMGWVVASGFGVCTRET